MHTTWTGPREMVVIPARPANVAAPPDWVDQVRRRLFYDPAPNGDDCSLRAYFDTVSYGKAQFQPVVLGEVVVTPSHCGAMQDEAIRTLPAGHSFERVCVVFPSNTAGGACAGWAFGFGSLFPGTSNLRGWCYVAMDAPMGTWAMELLHVLTYFGDLYNPINPAVPSPGRFDEMDCACGTHPSAVTKLHMGWLNATDVPVASRAADSRFTLHALGLRPPPPPGRVTAVRIPSLTDPTHYFLAECRFEMDRFERNTPGFSSGIPSSGVAVYEVDDVNPPFKMWLRTTTALSPGQQYSNPTERLVVEATASVWGGMEVTVRSTEPAECGTLRADIAGYEETLARLQEDLANATSPAEKAAVRRQMRPVEADLRAAGQRFRQLACLP
jgi:hypothetical protein